MTDAVPGNEDDSRVTPERTQLWRDTRFRLFWLGRVVSLTGSAVSLVVLPVLMYQLTGSAFKTAALTTVQALPYLVFGLFAGVLADRLDRRRLMLGSDLASALLMATIPLASLGGWLTVAHVYAVAALTGTAFVVFDAANFGAIPALVGRTRLVQANSAVWSSSTVIGIAGPALGGVLVGTIGAAEAVAVDAASYALSALLLARIPARSLGGGVDRRARAGSAVRSAFADIAEGLRFVAFQPLIRALALLGFGVSLSGGAVLGLLVVYAVEELGIASGDVRVGLLFSAGAAGALAATLVAPRLTSHFGSSAVTLAAIVANVAGLVGLVLSTGFAIGTLCYFGWSAAYMLVIVTGISLRQLVTPDELQGRVNVTARMIAWGGQPLGAAIGGAIASASSVRAAYAVMAIGAAISAIAGFRSPLRGGRAEAAAREAVEATGPS